jgi:hypothetical protein
MFFGRTAKTSTTENQPAFRRQTVIIKNTTSPNLYGVLEPSCARCRGELLGRRSRPSSPTSSRVLYIERVWAHRKTRVNTLLSCPTHDPFLCRLQPVNPLLTVSNPAGSGIAEQRGPHWCSAITTPRKIVFNTTYSYKPSDAHPYAKVLHLR